MTDDQLDALVSAANGTSGSDANLSNIVDALSHKLIRAATGPAPTESSSSTSSKGGGRGSSVGDAGAAALVNAEETGAAATTVNDNDDVNDEFAWIHNLRAGYTVPGQSAPACSRYDFQDHNSEEKGDSQPTEHVPDMVLEDDQEHIKSASLDALVKRLTHPHMPDLKIRFVFLLTYRKYITPIGLLEKMVHRYLVPLPAGAAATPAAQEQFRKTAMAPIQIKVFSVLRTWLEDHWYDFQDHPELRVRLQQFLSYVAAFPECTGPWSRAGASLERILRRKLRSKRDSSGGLDGGVRRRHRAHTKALHPNMSLPVSILPPGGVGTASFAPRRNDTIDTACLLNPIEVARQLTLVDYEIFSSIRATECLKKAWTKKDRRDAEAPHIWRMIQRFEHLTEWIATQIVRQRSMEDRVLVYEWAVELAAELHTLDNFHGSYAVFTALSSAAVSRLKQTRALLSPKRQQTLDDLRALFKTDRSSETLRRAMNAAVSPCIPHLGIFLSDLCVIDEFDSKAGEHINFRKCRKIAGIIERLLAYQAKPYRLRPVKAMTDHMRSLPGRLPRRETIQLSRKHEPKLPTPRKQ